jgi:hypothetical protein
MMIIAVTSAERFVKSACPIDDPSMDSVSMDPNEKQSGDVNLQPRFIGLDVREWRSHHANTELRVLRLFAPRKRLLPLSKKLPDGERRLVCLFARS